MKKELIIFLLAIVAGVTSAWADDNGTCGASLTWTFVESTGTLTITGTGEMYDYSSPNDVPWYSYRNNITSLSIPTGLTRIGNRAFYGCSSLPSINIPEGVTIIGVDAFTDCDGLTEIIIPNSVTDIGDDAFHSCSNLTEVTLGNHVELIGISAFGTCTGLTSVTIPESVVTIKTNAFIGCSALTEVIALPTTAPTLGSKAFDYCHSDLMLTYPCDSWASYSYTWGAYADKLINACTLTTIDEIYATAGTLTDPFNVKAERNIQCDNWVVSGIVGTTALVTDGEKGFLLNMASSSLSLAVEDKLNGLIINASVWKLDDKQNVEVKLSNANVSKLTITHDGVITPIIKTIDQLSGINTGAPVTIKGLKCTAISADVATMTDGPNTINVAPTLFNDALTGLEVGKYYDITGIFQNWKSTNPNRIYPRSAADIVEVNPSGRCGDNLFWEYNPSTTTLTITGTGDMYDYTSGNSPWYSYRLSITSIVLPVGLEHIGDYAFDTCPHVTSFTIPSTVTSIGDCAIRGFDGLTSITIPANVTTIGAQAFSQCSNLSLVEMLPINAPMVGVAVFVEFASSLVILCPCGADEASYHTSFVNYDDKLSFCPLTTMDEIIIAAKNGGGNKTLACDNWLISGYYTESSVHYMYITDGEKGFRLTLGASDEPFNTLAAGNKLNGLLLKVFVTTYNDNYGARINYGDNASIAHLTITNDGVITPLEKTIDVLTDENSGAPVTLKDLECTALNSTQATMSDGTNTIIIKKTLSNDALTGLEVGKHYHITGVFQKNKDNRDIYPRSAADIVALPPVAQVTTAASVTTPYYTFAEALAAWEENSTLKLLAPVEITDRIEVTTTCTLDLNGYGIKSSGDHEVFFLNTHGGTFTLDDSNTGNQTHRYKQNPSDVFAALNETEGEIVLSGGYITSGRGNMTETTSSSIRDGGAFFVLETTFIMNGGNIIGNYVWRHGSGVFIAKGSHFIMNGGRITHNYANLAGAVSVYANVTDINDNASSTMEMHGGEISYNFAKYNSGGIHSNSASASMYATITIDGGSIMNNHVSGTYNEHCGGIGIGGYSQIHISGNPTISGNTFGDVVENIYIYSGSTLIIDGELTNTTPLPVTLETSGVFTSGLSGNGTAANFAMENTGTYLVTNRNGEAAILAPMAVTANLDPNDLSTRYSTFYDGTIKYVVPAGVEVYMAEISGTDMLLHLIASAGDVLPWDEAVILKTTDAALELIPTDDAPTAASAANVLLGTDVAMAAPENCYVLSGGSTATYGITGIGFYLYTNTLAAHKAYLIYSGSSLAPKRFRFVFDSTTDIESPSLQGRSGEASKILRDGQLIIIRNGVEYNANGQMIK